jgi:hypothetical protein
VNTSPLDNGVDEVGGEVLQHFLVPVGPRYFNALDRNFFTQAEVQTQIVL